MIKKFTLLFCLSAYAQQLEHILPREIWTKILEQVPGDNLFLHQILYLKKPETGLPRIKISKKIAKNIITACEQKIEKMLFKELKPWWVQGNYKDNWYLSFSEAIRCLDHVEVHNHVSPFINKLSVMYHSCPEENKKLIHDVLWKRVLEQSHERWMDEYPGLECRKPINYDTVTTATIKLSKQIENSWKVGYKSYTVHKLDTIGKCAVAFFIIVDNKQLINKQQYGAQLTQLLPELHIEEKS